MTKFRIGDKVTCIKFDPKKGIEGSGWKLGYTFIINSTNTFDSTCYWPGINSCGVYEYALEFTNGDWDK